MPEEQQVMANSFLPGQESLEDIKQLAATYKLGTIQKEYRNDVSRHLTPAIVTCFIGILCFSPLLLVLLTGWEYIPGLRWICIIGIGFLYRGINRLTVAINTTGKKIIGQNPRIYHCFYGILLLKGSYVQAVRWDQIKALQKISIANVSNSPQQYILHLVDGREPLFLDKVSTEFNVLGLQIEHEVKKLLFPEYIAAYEAGERLNFDPISVTSQGIHLADEQKLFPWTIIGSVNECEGNLVIKERGTAAVLASIDTSTMLNLCVFLAVVRKIKQDSYTKKENPEILRYQPTQHVVPNPSEWAEYE